MYDRYFFISLREDNICISLQEFERILPIIRSGKKLIECTDLYGAACLINMDHVIYIIESSIEDERKEFYGDFE